jgi:hypothetical protein
MKLFKERNPQTVGEYNERLFSNKGILTGKQFRNKRRKEQREFSK